MAKPRKDTPEKGGHKSKSPIEMEQSTFFVTRFFVLSVGGLFSSPAKDGMRSDLFREAFFHNRDFEAEGISMKMRAIEHIGDTITGKLARGKTTDVHRATEKDFENTPVDTWPPAHFTVSFKRQLMVLEVKSAWGMTKKRICEVLSEAASNLMLKDGYAVQFEVVVPPGEFWDLIKHSEGVYAIRFKVNAPNLFGSSKSLTEDLREYRDLFNTTAQTFEVENKAGKLKTPHEELEKLRDYADAGGGEWTLKLKRNGKKVNINSQSRALTVKVSYDGDVTPQVLAEAVEKALNEVADDQ